MDGLWTEVCGQQKQSNDPGNNQHNPQYANYWAPLTRKRHIAPHPAQPQHANYWAPRTRKRHQQEHRPQRPTERSDPTQHAKGRTGDRPGPRKGATTRRNVTQGVWQVRNSERRNVAQQNCTTFCRGIQGPKPLSCLYQIYAHFLSITRFCGSELLGTSCFHFEPCFTDEPGDRPTAALRRCPSWGGAQGPSSLSVPPSIPPSRAPSLCPATVSLTASASFDGMRNRQQSPPTALATSNRLSNRFWGHL